MKKLIKKILLIPPVIFTSLILSAVILFLIHIITVQAIGTADTADVEAESGVVSGPVSVATDVNASGGQYIAFNAFSSPTPVVTITPSPTLLPTLAPTPTNTPTPTAIPQLTLTNLVVTDTSNAKSYSFQKNIQTGNVLYGDRTYTVKSLATQLQGNQWIRTANNSKTFNGGVTLMSFTISQKATVYVAVDKRIKKPSWLDSTWSQDSFTLVDNEGASITFAVFQKAFSQGTVTLGPNGGTSSSDMYTVIVK